MYNLQNSLLQSLNANLPQSEQKLKKVLRKYPRDRAPDDPEDDIEQRVAGDHLVRFYSDKKNAMNPHRRQFDAEEIDEVEEDLGKLRKLVQHTKESLDRTQETIDRTEEKFKKSKRSNDQMESIKELNKRVSLIKLQLAEVLKNRQHDPYFNSWEVVNEKVDFAYQRVYRKWNFNLPKNSKNRPLSELILAFLSEIHEKKNADILKIKNQQMEPENFVEAILISEEDSLKSLKSPQPEPEEEDAQNEEEEKTKINQEPTELGDAKNKKIQPDLQKSNSLSKDKKDTSQPFVDTSDDHNKKHKTEDPKKVMKESKKPSVADKKAGSNKGRGKRGKKQEQEEKDDDDEGDMEEEKPTVQHEEGMIEEKERQQDCLTSFFNKFISHIDGYPSQTLTQMVKEADRFLISSESEQSKMEKIFDSNEWKDRIRSDQERIRKALEENKNSQAIITKLKKNEASLQLLLTAEYKKVTQLKQELATKTAALEKYENAKKKKDVFDNKTGEQVHQMIKQTATRAGAPTVSTDITTSNTNVNSPSYDDHPEEQAERQEEDNKSLRERLRSQSKKGQKPTQQQQQPPPSNKSLFKPSGKSSGSITGKSPLVDKVKNNSTMPSKPNESVPNQVLDQNSGAPAAGKKTTSF